LKIRVGIFIRSLLPGGSEKQSFLLAEYLSKYYTTTLIVLYRFPNEVLPLSDTTFNVHYINGNHLLTKVFHLFLYLKKNKFNTLLNYLPINNILGIILGKVVGIRYLIGGIRSTKHKGFIRMTMQRLLCNNCADLFISNSYAAKELYTKKYGFEAEKIQVIQNGITLTDEYKAKDFTTDKIKILSVGRFIEEKDFFTAIDSIELLIQKHPLLRNKIEYTIIGYGSKKKEINDYINKKVLGSIVKTTDDKLLKDYYSTADIFINTSIVEGMPNTVMEAMSFKLPVIATDAGDTKYLVKDGINGFLVKKKDSITIAEKLALLISDPELVRQFGDNGYEFIKNNFSVNQTFSKYRELIDKLEIKNV
jgi:glycosyltransferase involved in cell wall biosynthesis